MNVTSAGRYPVQQNRKSKVSAAAKGAIFTAGVLGTSTAMSWVKEPETMRAVVAKTGGKGKYALSYVAWLAIYSAAGALVNTALTAISNVIKPNNPPKAN